MNTPMTDWLEKHPNGAVALLLDAEGDEHEATEPCFQALEADPQLMTIANWPANDEVAS